MIYTIGHSNHEMEHFIDILKNYKIEILVDVRSKPNSAYKDHFNKPFLIYELKKNNIKYLDMGKTLGGRPFDESVLNSLGEIELDKIEQREWYQNGISQLIDLSKNNRVAIMCSEENPAKCHRGYIVSHSLLNRGENVSHIRGDKSTQVAKSIGKQGVLFS